MSLDEASKNVNVVAKSEYMVTESSPELGRYIFTYKIKITNNSSKPLRLLRRHWIITDGFGRTEEVEGAGVIGQQPKIGPGESFEYDSFCPLPTPIGSMRGTYQMAMEDGSLINAEIPLFYLNDPGSYH